MGKITLVKYLYKTTGGKKRKKEKKRKKRGKKGDVQNLLSVDLTGEDNQYSVLLVDWTGENTSLYLQYQLIHRPGL